jgi:hypothetical protein
MKGFRKHRYCHPAAMWVLAAALWGAGLWPATAEDAADPAVTSTQPAPATSTPPPNGAFPAQPPPAPPHGFINSVGGWWHRSVADFGATMKAARQKLQNFNAQQNNAAKDAATTTQQALKDAAQASKDAASALVGLPHTRVLELRERCAVAANGAPDCGAAATNACRQKGFNSGKPIDIRTSRECPATVVLSGRMPTEGECPDETVILSAVCQ